MSDTDAILQSEYDRIQSSDDWYAYLGTILRNMPGGASVKMLTKEMRSLCSDPNRQIKYNPFRANDWNFALNSCERLNKWPHKSLFVEIQKRPAGNGGPHTGFRVLTYHGLVSMMMLCSVDLLIFISFATNQSHCPKFRSQNIFAS